ncbi:MAG TPA: PQQ-dependent sugar dehydrogenase, partial [Roseiflexaceae bacterium]
MNGRPKNGLLQRRWRIGVILALLGVLSACAAEASPGPPGGAPAQPPTPTPTVMAEPVTALPTASAPVSTLPLDAAVSVPPGYRAELYAQGLAQPTALTFGPDGRLYVAQLSGEIVALDGPGATAQVYIRGLERPLGLVWRGADLYVMSQGTLSIFPSSGAVSGNRRDLLTGIPTAGMQNNNLVLGQDGWLYMGIGSLCDHCPPDNPISGQIRRIKPDGSDWQTYATGLRNPFGLTVAPDGTLWATDNGREDLPHGLPPEELNRIIAGGDYGWPRCYGDRVPDPQGGGTIGNCAATIPPAATFPAHSSPVGLVFYTGGAFASDDNGALFVGLAGAWDRSPEHGRRIVRVRLRYNSPAESSDWSIGWGRPIGLIIAPNGALLVADHDRGT